MFSVGRSRDQERERNLLIMLAGRKCAERERVSGPAVPTDYGVAAQVEVDVIKAKDPEQQPLRSEEQQGYRLRSFI